MTRLLKNDSNLLHQPPGSILNSTDPQSEVQIELINYDSEKIEISTPASIQDCLGSAKDSSSLTWINIKGLNNSELIKDIGSYFGIHTLWLEDVLNTDHRPKLEELDDIIFCIIKAVGYKDQNLKQLKFEQVSLFLGDSFVVSFQELADDVFKPVVQRLNKKKGRIRESKADYLFYALIDSVVDEYFIVLEELGKEIESLEALIVQNFKPDIYQNISRLRNELIYLKKSAAPIRDVLNQCIITEKEEIQQKTKKYFKDAYDHIVQVVETIDSYFQMLEYSKDAFNSMQANKMNEVMKVLTVFSSVFIPLTFVAGIYGMNFEHIPEFKWEYGYFYFWGLTFVISIGLALFFKKKKWL